MFTKKGGKNIKTEHVLTSSDWLKCTIRFKVLQCTVYVVCNLLILVYFRDSWLCSVLKSVPKDDAYEHLSKSLELTRVHLLDIVTQYRALFPGNKKPSLIYLGVRLLKQTMLAVYGFHS